MLITEAKWFRKEIGRLDLIKIFPMLNVGSSTLKFRKKSQPWINKYLFEPLKKEKIIHLDIKEGEGIDMAADLAEQGIIPKIQSLGCRSILCSNLLEHLTTKKRKIVCQNLLEILPQSGYLFVSCPYCYPIHYDPIAAGYRPTTKELAANFPGTKIIKSKIVVDFNYLYYLLRNKTKAVKIIIRLLFPFYKYREWKTLLNHFPWLLKNFKTTCVLLKKTN